MYRRRRKKSELNFKAERECLLRDFLVNDKRVSKRLIAKLKRTEDGITSNGRPIRTVDRIFPGDVIVLRIGDSSLLEPCLIKDVRRAFENESLVVYDKPFSVPVHPSAKHRLDTLGNHFAAEYPKLTFRPVNRLDRDTSGLCLVAKNAYAARTLQGSVSKIYYAAVEGILEGDGVIELPIARERDTIIKRTVREDGQRAVTRYRALAHARGFTLLELILETGRTHQIRVHLSHIGYPLIGDDLYGGNTSVMSRQALHCGMLSFDDPITGKRISVKSPLSEDIKKLFE